ncbi:High mobility group (HMG) box domain-containing protein [Rozella allomycis CSF55]|uniref:FACT complex subunit POB3 n=1 Tax=Rozella allomycis (strain CSF55) TaxID=988480 RepID=A0A075B106_ROZAC|nr:High mobility group (HMG) box domain-containing protein [Rozella allomycis CSF55]|eukprot:EPZ36196.1 High mobility group (HMG) box domain-containing protein [Rozella allomycis CSF55]
MVDTIDYEGVYYYGKDGSVSGKIKFAESGLAFKDSGSGSITTVDLTQMKRLVWLRSARDYQIRIICEEGIYKFDGFPRDAYEEMKEFVKRWYDKPFEVQELSVKGYNWGQTEFQENAITFNVEGKTMFEIPVDQVSNAVVAAKNEISVEMHQSSKNKKGDQLTEIRFYIPGTVQIDEDTEEAAADVFYKRLKSLAELSTKSGEKIVTISDIQCVTPRGRYEFDMFPTFLRLRGKSYDYKIMYSSIVKLFLLPKPDDIHINFVIGLDPPIRQGQTRYPFFVLQFAKDDEMELEDLNFDEKMNQEKFEGKLRNRYEGPFYEIVSLLIKTLSQKKITVPGSYPTSSGIKCSMKASEGTLYPLERSFLFIPKPTIFMPHSDISSVEFSRVGANTSARSFDLKITMRSGIEYPFSNISKEEYSALQSFLIEKKIKVKSALEYEEVPGYAQEEYESASENSAAPEGSDSSEDEDFDGSKSQSDVAEEFDAEYESNSEQEGEEKENKDEEDENNETEKEKKKPKVEKPKKERKPKSEKKKDDGEKEKKKKKKKEGPKKALSAYIYFVSDMRAKIKAENPSASFTEVGKLVGQKWTSLSSTEKEKYEELARKDKIRYERELEEFKKKQTETSNDSTVMIIDE